MITNRLNPSNFKEWLWSAKVLTTIVWVFIPIGYFAIVLIFFPPTMQTTMLHDLFSPIPVFRFSIGEDYTIFLPPIPLMAGLFVFAVFSAIYSSEEFFRKRGYVNAVIEYQYVRRILYVSLLLIVTIIIWEHYVLSVQLGTYSDLVALGNALYQAIFILPAVPISILLKLLLEHARKEFGFYYSEACFEIITKTESETDKTSYLILGLEWYNKFVKRVTREGCDIETIFSKIVSHAQLSDNILLATIVESFNGEDKLKPMRHMLSLLSSWKEGGGSLTKQSLRVKIRESSDLLIPIVTVIITIMSTFFLKSPK